MISMETPTQQSPLEDNFVTLSLTQLSLFPLDPWGAEHVIAVFDNPAEGIARAMIGPIELGCGRAGIDLNLRCLVVAADREYAALVELSSSSLADTKSLWLEVIEKLNATRYKQLESSCESPLVTPPDCFKTWTDISRWSLPWNARDPVDASMRSLARSLALQELGSLSKISDSDRHRMELQARVEIAIQISKFGTFVLSSLRPDLFEVFVSRQRLSIAMGCNLVALARGYGTEAIKYAVQALRTESVGLLSLITMQQPWDESLQIRDAIFSGKSLPDAFEGIGVPKYSHRRTLRQAHSMNETSSPDTLALSELAISGGDWLLAMRLSRDSPPRTKVQWIDFCRLVQRIVFLNLQELSVTPAILRWSAKEDYRNGVARLDLLLEQGAAIQRAALFLTGIVVTVTEALEVCLKMDDEMEDWGPWTSVPQFRLDPELIPQLVMIVSKMSGNSLESLMQGLMRLHPRIPTSFAALKFTEIRLLNSIELAMGHGHSFGNCLRSPQTVIQYVTSGVALYEIHTPSGLAGTAALRFDNTEDHPRVEVQELEERGASHSEIELCRIAQLLADSWETRSEIDEWVAYELRCSEWRQSLLISRDASG
jgi:hypothetical protein